MKLQILGATQNKRLLIKLDGIVIWLSNKSFKYLVLLSIARLTSPEGWITCEDIEPGKNQARYLHRLRNELRTCLTESSWRVYESNRRGSYRLALDSSEVEIDLEVLSNSDDYDIRQAVKKLEVVSQVR